MSPAASPAAGDKPDKLASPAKGEAEKKGKKGRNWAGENKALLHTFWLIY